MIRDPFRHENNDVPSPGTVPREFGERQDSAREDTRVARRRQMLRMQMDSLIKGHGEKTAVILFRTAGHIAGSNLVCDSLYRGACFRRFGSFLQNGLKNQGVDILRVEVVDQDTGDLVIFVTKGIGCDGIPAADRAFLVYDEGFKSGVLSAIDCLLKAYPDRRGTILRGV